MKKLFFLTMLFLGCLTLKPAIAQVNVQVNIGSQPDWGPTGYDHVDYYYLPEAHAYYDVSAHDYVVHEASGWHHMRELPRGYNFDKYKSYKVVVNEPNPWEHNDVISAKYRNFAGRHDQVVIRDSREEKYRNHWHEH